MRLSFGLAIAGLLFARSAAAQDLAPPPPMDPNAPNGPPPAQTTQVAETNRTLDEGEKEDSGRGLEWVWLNAEVGASYINMEQFNSNNLALEKSSSAGPMFGLGAGIRLFVLTFGVRARLHQLSAFNLWEVNGEIGLHVPIKRIDPYISLHGGYAFVGSLSSDSLGAASSNSAGDVSIHGFDVGLSGGLDYYFTKALSVGLDVTLDALFLKRPPTPLPAGLTTAEQAAIRQQPLYANSGDSAGFGMSGSLHLGVHF